MEVRILEASDAAVFQELRLAGLRECPSAFASSFEEEQGLSADAVAARLGPKPGSCVVGSFDSGRLIAIGGLVRETKAKLAHKAFIWGVYVAPEARRRGAGRMVMERLIGLGTAMPGLLQIHLGVNARNAPAIALYESLGFRPFGIEPGYLMVGGVLHDELRMLLILTPCP